MQMQKGDDILRIFNEDILHSLILISGICRILMKDYFSYSFHFLRNHVDPQVL